MVRFLRYAALSVATLALALPVSPAHGEDGNIVISRTLQPRVATRPTMVPDPHPMQVNANTAPQVSQVLLDTGVRELQDDDFARITSGSAVQPAVAGGLDGVHNRISEGANTTANLGGNIAGHGGGLGGRIANSVDNSLQRGLAPLQVLGGGR
ncbi:hypothetical protein D9M68_255910 [compost metagenome]|uniref:Uncharacterized protein n=1 Tax=Pseudomonas jinjuensis TaxID=198616 RepID=A0A1H0D174_9PSED|nr:hypothetical protein [Pseudomonas jinjuensis]SDN63914.1 hypothetical protein SAMN05216193_10499 [Pseudomonas jinjuensis]